MFNNPLAEARWLRFKANKRGFISLWIFTVLFGLSLFAEIIANDKPLLVSYDNQCFAAGYGQQQVLEVILGLSQKVISNYVNHVAKTPVDKVFEQFAWQG